MKRIHVAKHAPEAHLVQGFLASHGIATQVRGEMLTSGWGELPVDLCSVWVRDDRDLSRAEEIVRAFFAGEAAREHGADRWTCGSCSERLEGQFTDCWRCGKSRET